VSLNSLVAIPLGANAIPAAIASGNGSDRPADTSISGPPPRRRA